MYSTRRTGETYTSVRLHPFKLLILAWALLVVGCAMVTDGGILWLLVGCACIAGNVVLVAIAIRQLFRALRTFFS